MKNRAVFGMVLTILAGCLQANINNIKGTYTILKDEFKDLSVIHGGVAWETGTIRRMYDYGALGQHGERIKSKTIALVHRLFARNPGFTGDADFVVTKDIRKLEEKESVFFVAAMLMYLRQVAQSPVFKQYMTTNASRQQALVEKTSNPSQQGLAKKLDKLQRELAKQRDALIKQVEELVEYKRFAEEYKKIVPYVVQAYLECAVDDYLPAYTPQLILLALLYKETECNKEYLQSYYKQLNERLGCLAKPVDAAWQSETFKNSDRDVFLRELQAAPLTQERLQKFYEEYVFVYFAATDYPPIAAYGEAVFKEKTFTDCMDTALRNFINVLAYDAKSNRFDLSLFERRLGKAVHSRLKGFYGTEAHADPSMVASKKVHSAWANMVSSDIPYVAYNGAVPESTLLVKGAPGFIKTDGANQGLQTFLTEKGFIRVADDASVYTMKPSMKNAIIALNYLFELNLFEGKLPQEFMRSDFVVTYLPKLATALHATIPSVEGSDDRDFTSTIMVTPFTFTFTDKKKKNQTLVFKTENLHGVLELCSTQEQPITVPVAEKVDERSPLSLLLMTSSIDSVVLTPTRLFLWLFAQNLGNQALLAELKKVSLPLNDAALKVLQFAAKE